MARKAISADVEKEVLVRSRRRCCICYGLYRDYGVRKGQIAHVDQDNQNSVVENLVFLCLEHHDEYDSTPSQAKGLTVKELLHYRDELYAAIDEEFAKEAQRRNLARRPGPMVQRMLTNDSLFLRSDAKDALKFHVLPHRTRSVVLLLAGKPMKLEEINSKIPPCDLEWTKTMVKSTIDAGWVLAPLTIDGEHRISEKGKTILRVLLEIPDFIKNAEWDSVWRTSPQMPDSR